MKKILEGRLPSLPPHQVMPTNLVMTAAFYILWGFLIRWSSTTWAVLLTASLNNLRIALAKLQRFHNTECETVLGRYLTPVYGILLPTRLVRRSLQEKYHRLRTQGAHSPQNNHEWGRRVCSHFHPRNCWASVYEISTGLSSHFTGILGSSTV